MTDETVPPAAPAPAGPGFPLAETARSYDAVADRYTEEIAGELVGKPLDRALLDCLVELVAGRGPIGDVGCGPGHVAAYLAGKGATTVGVDLSSRMIENARERYPDLRFEVGSMTGLPVADGSWGGAVCAYSIIHLDADRRPTAYAELARAVAPGGWVLMSFHVSDADAAPGTSRHLASWWGHDVDLDFHFLDPDDVAKGLESAGFEMRARTLREPWPEVEHPSRRAYLLACRTGNLR
jgi:SAM-dependent methyltransferase